MADSGVTEISVSHECMQNTAEIVDSRCVNCLQLRNELEEALNEVKSLQLIINFFGKMNFLTPIPQIRIIISERNYLNIVRMIALD